MKIILFTCLMVMYYQTIPSQDSLQQHTQYGNNLCVTYGIPEPEIMFWK